MSAAETELQGEVLRWMAATGTKRTSLRRASEIGYVALCLFLDDAIISPMLADRVRQVLRDAPHGCDSYGNSRPALGEPAFGRVKVSERASIAGVIGMDEAALAARIAADQARIHGPRRAQLELEQRKYGLPRMGKLPEEMVA